MDDSEDFDARVFHTPHEPSGGRSEEKRISRPATPFARRQTRKLLEQDGEPLSLFNSVPSKTFLSNVLFLKLVLVAIISHHILSETAVHMDELKEYHNPAVVLVPVSAICIFLAMISLGTSRPLLFIPYLIVQFGSWVLAALICTAVSWHHHREFFTRREFGIAVASLILPLWIWSYITFVAFRVFFSMIHQQKLRRLEKNRNPEHGLLVKEEDVIVFEKPSTVRHASESNKKRVRFTDILGKQ